MRPIKLTMSAFGPYAEPTTIDFEKLGSSGVYLVCGDTGAGKTMIFDALCFALFGEASGDAKGGARSTSSLRSDYADSTTKTFVKLEFEYRGKRYLITRNPEYVRAKERGEGETREAPKAEIEMPDGRCITGLKNVNAEVEGLLGIDSGQFKQIVMLAQGEFRKLLTADTDAREDIFRKLFGTEVYEKVQESLAAECRSLNRDYDKMKERVKTLSERAVFPEGSALAEELADKLAAGEQMGSWLVEALGKQLEADRPAYEQLDEEVETLRRKWGDANARLQSFESRSAIEAEKQKLENRDAELKAEAPALEKAFAEQKEHDAERSRAIEIAARIAGTFPKYEELQTETETRAKLNDKRAEAQKRADECKAAYESAHADAEALSKDIAALDGAEVRHAEAKAALDAAAREAKEAQETLANARKLETRETEVAQADKALAIAEAAWEKAAESERAAHEALEAAREKHDAFEGAAADRIAKNAAFIHAKKEADEAAALVRKRDELVCSLDKARAPHEEAIDELKTKESAHDLDLAHLQDLQKRQRAGRAGILAAELSDGKPCPVCGSEHHPHPAPTAGSIPSDDEVDEAAERERRSKAEADKASVQAERLRAVRDEKGKLLAAFDEEHGGRAGLDELTHATRTALETAQSALRAAEAREAEAERAKKAFAEVQEKHDAAAELLKRAEEERLQKRESAIGAQASLRAMKQSLGSLDIKAAQAKSEDAQKKLQTATQHADVAKNDEELLRAKRAAHDTARSKEAEAQGNLEKAQADARKACEDEKLVDERIAHLKGDLEFSSLAEAQAEEARLRKTAADFEAARNAAEKAVRENAESQRTNNELLKDKIKQLEDAPQGDPESTKQFMKDCEQQGNEKKTLARTVKSRLDANEACHADLGAALRKTDDIESRYGRVKQLADAATGNVVGKAKIRFEAYVQAIYFDKVIDAANQRLKALTSGQFELVRYSEGSGNAKAGLGLYVNDSFTGRARDASSLSGGESFQASLCLALGLSDIVQAHAGGIEFDTMFVDEGFGSLDQGALGNAISLLSDLSGGTKLVGIISHVEDLKANIPKKIVVTKDRTGSKVNLEL